MIVLYDEKYYPFCPKKSPNFLCKKCDYCTSNKKDYNKHLLTLKHKKLSDDEEICPILVDKIYKCDCGKIYKHSSSLWNHKKKCDIKNYTKSDTDFDSDKEMIKLILQDNSELKKLIIELAKMR